MTILDAVCPECGLTFEVFFSRNPEFRDPEMCPECGFEFVPPGPSSPGSFGGPSRGPRSVPFSHPVNRKSAGMNREYETGAKGVTEGADCAQFQAEDFPTTAFRPNIVLRRTPFAWPVTPLTRKGGVK
jgi:hypothetical protein